MINNSTKAIKVQPVKVNGRKVGEIVGDILRKNASFKSHLLQNPRGWTWDIAILEKARKAGVHLIVIIEIDSKWIYKSTFEDFMQNSVFIDRGYGQQRCLPLNFWTVIKPTC
jgi:hypothetical protein